MPVRRGWRPWTLGSLGLALAARLVAGPLPLNYYDVAYALVWGRQILHGALPDYSTPGASTPHPLGTLLATLAAVCGSPGAWYAVQAIVFLSLGVAGTALFMLTRSCLRENATVGAVVAVGALLLSPPFLTGALGGSGLSDMPALALILAAAAAIAGRPTVARMPLVLLGLAGLMRPEAWGLAAAYWLFLAASKTPRRELLEAAALGLAAPIVWAVCDAIVAGDPTYSLTHTQDASIAGAFVHGVGHVPTAAIHGLRDLIGLPVLLVGAIGAAAALALARRGATLVPLGLLAVALGEFVVLGVGNVPLLPRFLLVPAAMISFFFAYAVTARRDRCVGPERPALRRLWSAAAAVLVVFVAASHLAGDIHVRRDQRAAVHAETDLVALTDRPEVRAALRSCPDFYVARFTLTSLVAYDFDRPPQTIRRTSTRPPAHGLILVPVSTTAGAAFGVTPPRLRTVRDVTRGSTLVSRDRSWRLYARGCV